MTNTEIRDRIFEITERVVRVVIKRNGEIHVYGRMPNTNQIGWYLYGDRDELAREFSYEHAS